MYEYSVIRAGMDARNMNNWSVIRMTPEEAEKLRALDFICIAFGVDC